MLGKKKNHVKTELLQSLATWKDCGRAENKKALKKSI